MQLKKTGINYFHIIFLFLLTFLLRFLPIMTGNFTFMYDHAKDSLVIREMGLNHKPALFGAVTSIPGVYNGPLFYYLALPLNILMNYHPLSSVITVIILASFSCILLYQKKGLFPAFLYAIGSGVIGVQNSAWTPYMTVFTVLPLVLILEDIHKRKKITLIQTASLFLLVSFTFHFQTAFAVVLLPIIIINLLYLDRRKIIKLNLKHYLIGLIAFILPFMPWFVFELRHDFHQSKQIINFIKDYGKQAEVINPNQQGFARFEEVIKYITDSLKSAVAPAGSLILVFLILVVDLVYYQQRFYKEKRFDYLSILYLSFLVIPLLFYQILPCKPYYLAALVPLGILIFTRAIDLYFKNIKPYVLGLFIFLAIINFYQSFKVATRISQDQSIFYAPKEKAVLKVYELAGDKSFVSYQFVPEIYDYTYQHIFMNKIDRGFQKPNEFSYAPGETTYIQQKHFEVENKEPDKVFLIVENDYSNAKIFDSWWNRVVVNKLEIINYYAINSSIKVYEARKIAPQ